MASIRSRTDNSLLFFDFRFNGKRCREQTLLPDTPTNRKKLEKVLARIESEIAAGTFVYESYFPSSKALNRLNKSKSEPKADTATASQSVGSIVTETVLIPISIGPLFTEFANKWFDERSIEWRRSHIKSLLSTLNGHLIPYFGDKVVGSITKSEVLEFRATLAKVKGRGTKEGLSSKRINEIMGLLRQIINEAADRFEFTSPVTNIRLNIVTDQATAAHALGDTLNLARRYKLSAYDAAYLELALRTGLPLATLDASLVKAATTAGVPIFYAH